MKAVWLIDLCSDEKAVGDWNQFKSQERKIVFYFLIWGDLEEPCSWVPVFRSGAVGEI